jgi:hypothetical protein
VLIPPDAGKRDTPRQGWDGGRYTLMRQALATSYGGGLYRRRKVMVEPVFAQTKHNRRINQFQRRGRSAARSEWRLITAAHYAEARIMSICLANPALGAVFGVLRSA